MRAPVHPMGWPSAIAPPLTFRRSAEIGTSRTTASTCAANASFSSTRSKSSTVRPVRSVSFCIAGTGPMPMIRGSTPALAQPRILARGVRPRLCAASADVRTSAAPPSVIPDDVPAVMMPGPIAKNRRQLAEAFDCRLSTRVLIAIHDHRIRPGQSDRGNLALEVAGVDRRFRLPLALQGEAVGFIAGDAVVLRQDFSSLAHDQVRERTLEAVAVHRVDEREIPHAMAPAGIRRLDQIRHPAHRLDAAGEDDLRFAEHDRLGAGHEGLQSRRACFVDGLRRRGVRKPGSMPDLPGGIRTGSSLTAVAHPGVLDIRWGQTRTRDRRARGDRSELRGVQVAERTAVFPDGRTRSAEDDDVTGGHQPTIVERVLSERPTGQVQRIRLAAVSRVQKDPAYVGRATFVRR